MRTSDDSAKRVAIVGYPLRHTISPIFQQAAFDHLGIPIRYEVWETPPGELGPTFERFRADDCLGGNVTVPHKEAALALVDGIDPLAARIGAANTIVHGAGRLTAYNTDAGGFLRALREGSRFDPAGQAALLLGAGGAARAIAFALGEAGAQELVVVNRDVRRAERLLEDLAERVDRPLPMRAVAWDSPEVGQVAKLAPLVVNCTVLGMRHGPGEDLSPLAADQIAPGSLICDLVYTPTETPLLRLARAVGARVLGGLPMLVYQGAAAFELWTGRTAPIEVMFAAARAALGEPT